MATSAKILPIFSGTSAAEEVADALASEIRGKNVLVTGTSINGIGFETARAIAKYAALVVITGYNTERSVFLPFIRALQVLVLILPGPGPLGYAYRRRQSIRSSPAPKSARSNLTSPSLAAVRKAAAEVIAYDEPLHVLINNAAATETVSGLTIDNLEVQMAAGHIAPFLFTKLVYPKLQGSRTTDWTPRVVFVSSDQHAAGDGVPLDKETFARGTGAAADDPALGLFARYGAVKSANVLTAREMAKRGASKVRAYSLHPGSIVTNAFSKGFKGALEQLGIIDAEGKPGTVLPFKTLPQGAATTVVAAFDPRIAAHSGEFLQDSVLAEEKVASHSADMARAAKLWELTEDVLGERFEL
ncbi:Short-chain dehydrogenase/reductase family protein [Mycena indigotica]|uniref:Short-chain dehydrogenase/reductase family protein n=1 Tax=Mycena indigotica TaxID=2126181 RepID=A0A8H6SHU6_9AGAR|nr:Short-chain dehydrogenase/reductase family protein [Mycena indigotica]KAF7298617.1 Short-chain dehydrogenase/reductase family protein [Mycena indigotica]